MSEQKTLTLKFEDQEKIVPIFKEYKEFLIGFQKCFSIDDEKAKKLYLFYYDNEGDKIAIQSDSDYTNIFQDDTEKEIIIQGEIQDNKEDSISIQFNGDRKGQDQNGDINLKNLDTSSFLGNSLSIENLNDIDFQKKNKEYEEINKGINQMNIMTNKAIEEINKESLIEQMKKQMDEMIRNHQEELKKKEEENEKYKLALAQKEEEMKKKLEEKEKKLKEDKQRIEREIIEKYESEMKSSILIKEKELEEMKSKI